MIFIEKQFHYRINVKGTVSLSYTRMIIILFTSFLLKFPVVVQFINIMTK